MNGKRHFENTDDVQSKKAKSTDSRSKNHISLEYNPTLNDEYNFNDASSHGGPTFRAIEDDESLSFDYGIDCLDDFDDANRQPAAGRFQSVLKFFQKLDCFNIYVVFTFLRHRHFELRLLIICNEADFF